MAHARLCYTSEGQLDCACEDMDAGDLLHEHLHPGYILHSCPVCGADVTYAHQWCPKCLRESVK